MKQKSSDIFMKNSIFAWIALATAIILAVPLIAMQFTDELNWTLSDFIIIGMLLLSTGSLFTLTARKIHPTSLRILTGALFGLALLYIWAELSVGIFTNLGS